MAQQEEWEFSSLKWIHHVREAQYRKTKDLPVETWLKPVDARKAIEACRRMGLTVKMASAKRAGSDRIR